MWFLFRKTKIQSNIWNVICPYKKLNSFVHSLKNRCMLPWMLQRSELCTGGGSSNCVANLSRENLNFQIYRKIFMNAFHRARHIEMIKFFSALRIFHQS